MSKGAELLDQLHETITTYVALPSIEAEYAATLWAAATHAQPAFQNAPRLVATSPIQECGKTRLLEVLAEASHKRLMTAHATVAAIFRQMGFNLSATIRTTEKDLSKHPLGPNIRTGDSHPVGSALKGVFGQEARVTPGGIRLFASRSARESHRIRGVELAGADAEVLGALASSRLGFRDGTLARNVLGQTFVIADGRRRAISEDTMRRMGYKEQNVRSMGLEHGAHEPGPPL